MADAYRLIASNAAGVPPDLFTAIDARFVAARQDKDGDWNSFHARPPASHSRFSMTAIALRSLQLYGHPSQQAEMKSRIARAAAWLESHSPHDTEGRTFQLLGLHWAGAAKSAIAKSAIQRPVIVEAQHGAGLILLAHGDDFSIGLHRHAFE